MYIYTHNRFYMYTHYTPLYHITYPHVAPSLSFTPTFPDQTLHPHADRSSAGDQNKGLTHPPSLHPHPPLRGEAGAVKRRRQPPRKEREGDVEEEEEEEEEAAGRREGRERGDGGDEADGVCEFSFCFSPPWPCGAYATRAIALWRGWENGFLGWWSVFVWCVSVGVA
jgi:hypothetical protein